VALEVSAVSTEEEEPQNEAEALPNALLNMVSIGSNATRILRAIGIVTVLTCNARKAAAMARGTA